MGTGWVWPTACARAELEADRVQHRLHRRASSGALLDRRERLCHGGVVGRGIVQQRRQRRRLQLDEVRLRHGDQRRAAGLDEHRPLAGSQRRVALAQDREVEGGIPECPRERHDLLERAAHTAVYAPSMTMLWPTMYDEASEHRKATRPSRSLGSPMRPAGIMPRQRSASSGFDSVNCRVMSDRK